MSRSEIESKLKLTRIIQVSLVLSVPVLAALIELGREPGSERWTIWRWVVTGLALGCVFEAFRYRRLWVRPSQQILAGDPSNARALRQWEVGQVVVLSMAEAVAAYGLVVRAVLNGTLWQPCLSIWQRYSYCWFLPHAECPPRLSKPKTQFFYAGADRAIAPPRSPIPILTP